MPRTEDDRAEAAGMAVNEAQGYVVRALRALDDARTKLQDTSLTHVIRVVDDPCTRSLNGRDISIALTDLEGVLLRLKHGTPR